MDFNISLENEFIPEWHNNKTLPENEQIKIKWTWPTAIDLQECVEIVLENGKEVVRSNYYKLVERCTKEIINLSVNNKIIKTGTQLINQPGLGDLSAEYRLFLRLTDIDEKNS